MSASTLVKLIAGFGLAATLVLLGGCAYDYLQHTDRVGYSAGDAVKANLEQQTIDPSKGSQYNTKGLGKNGIVQTTSSEEAAAAAAAQP